jgi:hypothetical protein
MLGVVVPIKLIKKLKRFGKVGPEYFSGRRAEQLEKNQM